MVQEQSQQPVGSDAEGLSEFGLHEEYSEQIEGASELGEDEMTEQYSEYGQELEDRREKRMDIVLAHLLQGKSEAEQAQVIDEIHQEDPGLAERLR